MATIDDKVVAMSFESSKFESGVTSTISALDKLKAALKFDKAGKGLDDINAAGKRVDLSHIGKAVDDIKGKFSALSVAALAVFANIVTKAVSAGAALVKSVTLDPIIQGFHEYETSIGAVQTILSNTRAAGTKLSDVNKTLDELNSYADKTIYNFSEMTKNIGTFTAAGVDLKTATASIKGIANLAALSGSNSQQAATAMYQLSQAISAGRVGLQDWNSVVNAGMGGTVFQRALAQTAEQMGTLKKGAVELVGPMKNVSINGESFRQSMQAGPGKDPWLTGKVLTSTLKQLSGDMTDAQLKAEGFSAAQIKAIQDQAKMALAAATQVKTLSQLLDTTKEAVGSGWAKTWQIIFGDFGEAKSLFTGLSNSIGAFVSASSDARNKVLQDWKDLGGRTLLIDALKQAFQDLIAVLKPIKDAFRDVFPAATGKDLYDLTVRFKDLMDALKPSQATIENLHSTFRGLFAILDIGKQVLGGIFSVFGKLFGVISGGSGSFLSLTGGIGDFLYALDQTLKKGGQIQSFFDGLGSILSVPLKILKELAGAIGSLFGGFSSGGFSGQMAGMGQALTPLQKILEGLTTAWTNFLDSMSNAGQVLKPIFDALISLISGLGTAIGQAASNMNFEAILQVIRTGLFAGLVLMFKQFLGKGSFLDQISKGFAGGILGNISGTFKALEGSMVAMQQNIKAKTLKEIGIAIALLAASVLAMSLVDPTRLNASLGALTVGMGELVGALVILEKMSTTFGFAKLPFITGSLILLAGAIDLLTISVLAMSRLSWEGLLKGLAGVGVLLGIVAVAVVPLSANSAGMIKAGIGLTAIAVALRILASAVSAFASMSWGEMGKGLVGVAAGLTALVVAMKFMPPSAVLSGLGIIAVAAGLRILASVVAKFGGMDWGTIGKGLAAVGGALVIIAGAMQLMPTTMVITAAGLLLVSVALGKIASAVESMGGMSLGEIARGLGTLAGSLIILAAAMYAMSGALAGAAALAVAAAGIAILAPALVALGKMSWEQIIKGLATLAGALTILGIAGVALAPTIPALLGLGAALLLLGGGLALAGVGIALIGTGLSAIAVAAPTAVGVLVAAFNDLVEGVIKNAKLLVLGLLEIVKAIADTAPKFVDALIKIIDALLDAIIRSAPKLREAFNTLINLLIQVVHDNQPKIIQAGIDLVIALIQGIKNNISALITQVVDLITAFLNAIANNLGRILTAGQEILTNLIKGILAGLSKVTSTALDIITEIIRALASTAGKLASAGLEVLTAMLKGISDHLGDAIRAGTDAIVHLITGIGDAIPRVIAAGVEAITKFINAVSEGAVKLANVGMVAIVNFLNGVAKAIDAHAGEMRAAGLRVGIAIVDGMTGGLASKAEELYGKISGIMDHAMSLVHKIPLIGSPSKVTYDVGTNIVLGLVKGLDATAPQAYTAAENMSNGVIKAVNDTFQTASPSKVMHEIGQFVGQGFAQGIRGSSDDIKGAFEDLNSKLTDAMVAARETIASEQDKLEELRKAKKPDTQAIKEAQQIIETNQALLDRSTAGHVALVSTLKDEKQELLALSGEFETLGGKLDDAKSKLADAKKTRADAIKSYTDQYSALPDVVAKDAEGKNVDALATYIKALQNQTSAVGAYKSTLEQLRKLGLDDSTYQKLLTEGTADEAFAKQILSGGKKAVDRLNELDKNLVYVSKGLGTHAGDELYQAGIDSMAGLVRGLEKKKGDVFEKMRDIADEMVSEMRRELKIKSPSEVFAEIGGLSMEGMAKGISDSSTIVTDSIEYAAKDALTTMRQSMRGISDAVLEQLDPNPVITPILDLTTVKAQSKELAALTSTPITAGTSYTQASTISAAQTATQTEQTMAAPGGTSVVFEQNNYSPESLSDIEIYRQTRNQLSQLKSALALT